MMNIAIFISAAGWTTKKPPINLKENDVARENYAFKKRQREIAQKKKREEKLRKKQEKKNPPGEAESVTQQDAGVQPVQDQGV
jgi:hypothetical protein